MSIRSFSPSSRVTTIAAAKPFRMLHDFYSHSGYGERRYEPGVLDLTFGDPHDPPSQAYVDILRETVIPQHELWFGYSMDHLPAREAAAESVRRHTGIPFQADDLFLTTGGFGAITAALKLVGDPGDEVLYSLPPWFLYEGLIVEAGMTPVKVSIDRETLGLDLDAIAAAITPRTRIVIVNTPNNPTGRIYPIEALMGLAAILDEASERFGRRIYLISDEPYNRIVFDGNTFHSPLEVYPHAFMAYSYGKTLLSPGQRVGYLAMSPQMPDRDRVRSMVETIQVTGGWLFPNSVMQFALPRLEELAFDIDLYTRKRDTLVDALLEIGYDVHRPEGAFYLFPRSPIEDDQAFAATLSDLGVLVLPGTMFETPGFFRITLTATLETIEASIPRFAEAFATATGRVVQGVGIA
ncbi:MAG TPA: aminotransferase class I/II-fold pyridoxal phosphate-dependent enzyme [Thermomicrobiales bacterium]|nr:aminotransferase class I/II-fold pyridoxal phosphate-dependent enzyme [Thermomicrobiales bacterium]